MSSTTRTDAALQLFSHTELTHHKNYTSDLTKLRGAMEGIVVRDPAGAAKVNNVLVEAKRIAKHVDMVRREQVDPLNDQVKAINGAWKPLLDACAQVETVAKRLLLAWQTAERERVAREQAAARRAQEAADLARYEAEQRAAQARTEAERQAAQQEIATADAALLEARVAEPLPAPTGIRTEEGTTSTRTRKAFQVTRPDLVPREYLMVDEKKVRAAVLAGAQEIPGVLIYEEEILATRLG